MSEQNVAAEDLQEQSAAKTEDSQGTAAGKEKLSVVKNTKESEETISAQQAELLEALGVRLTEKQQEIEEKNAAIHEKDANNIVKNHVMTGSAAGLVPMPVFDILALSATQLNMIRSLSKHYDIDFDKNRVKSLILSLVGGSIPTLAILGLSSTSKLVPGIGTLGGNASLSIVGGALTYATGQTFNKHFSEGGTLKDFEPKRFLAFFKEELYNGRHFVMNLAKKKKKVEAEAEKTDTKTTEAAA